MKQQLLLLKLIGIKDTTSYNGTKVLDGTFTSKILQVGFLKDEEIAISVDSVASASIGTFQLKSDAVAYEITDGTNDNVETSITIDGHLGSANADVAAGSSAKVMAAAITADAASTGVSATAVTYALINNLTVDGTKLTLTTDDAILV